MADVRTAVRGSKIESLAYAYERHIVSVYRIYNKSSCLIVGEGGSAADG